MNAMTDNTASQPPPKKEEKKPASSGNSNRGPRKQSQGAKSAPGSGPQGGPRPSSRSSNKRGQNESGSESASKKGPEGGKRTDNRGKPPGGPGRGQNRGQSQGGRNNNASKDIKPPTDGSDAMTSLQRVIGELKSTSPAPPANAGAQNTSTLPLNAPVFQPGAAAYPGTGAIASDPRHRKATSLGAPHGGHFNSFSPHLESMAEDGIVMEEGEDQFPSQPSHQPRSQSQSFVAPRFAALAQQDQVDTVGPTGRPQLAPGFMFGAGGAKRRNAPMGPPINEEDMGFQFPQQQQQGYQSEAPMQKEGGEISDIMAEQVCRLVHSRIHSLTYFSAIDCHSKPNRSPSTATTSALPAAAGHRSGHVPQ
jgi:protein SSD1